MSVSPPTTRRLRRGWAYAAALCGLFLVPVAASATTPGCILGPQPAATLLLPYFEVDLDEPEGLTTLFSVSNQSDEPQVARVTVWTDWALPTLHFDLLVGPSGVQSINLRRVLVEGELPVANPSHEPPGSCTNPLVNPSLDADLLADLRRRLTGQPDPDTGLCSGHGGGTPSLATGYLTIDALSDCSEVIRYPTDPGYFSADGSGLASNANVLFGDVFLVDGSGDSAQGSALVHLVAAPERFGEGSELPSFYSSIIDSVLDARLPLSSRWRARYLNGGAFDGTEVLLWTSPFGLATPLECDTSPLQLTVAPGWFVGARPESGGPSLTSGFLAPNAFASRLVVGSDELPVAGPFGTLDFEGVVHCGICSPPFAGGWTGWVQPIHAAGGRFSAGLEAVRIDDPCAP